MSSMLGFTLLELVVVAAVSSVLLLLLLRWVLTLSTASSTTLDNATVQREADAAADAFSADISRAVACSPQQPHALSAIGPAKVTFTVPSAVNAAMSDKVTWSLEETADGTTLVRKVALHDPESADPCAVSDAQRTKTYSTNVAPVDVDLITAGGTTSSPAFVPLTDGHPVADDAWGTCPPASDAARCDADAIGVSWLFDTPTGRTTPVNVTRTYLFTATAGALQ